MLRRVSLMPMRVSRRLLCVFSRTGYWVVNQPDGAGQVDIVDQLLTAVALKVYQNAVGKWAPPPLFNPETQTGQQEILRVGVISGGSIADQGAGLLSCQLDGHGLVVEEGFRSSRFDQDARFFRQAPATWEAHFVGVAARAFCAAAQEVPGQ